MYIRFVCCLLSTRCVSGLCAHQSLARAWLWGKKKLTAFIGTYVQNQASRTEYQGKRLIHSRRKNKVCERPPRAPECARIVPRPWPMCPAGLPLSGYATFFAQKYSCEGKNWKKSQNFTSIRTRKMYLVCCTYISRYSISAVPKRLNQYWYLAWTDCVTLSTVSCLSYCFYYCLPGSILGSYTWHLLCVQRR